MKESGDTYYRAQVDPVTADKRARVIPHVGVLKRRQIALDVASNLTQLRIRGDTLYADTDSTGSLKLFLNDPSGDPLPFLAQSGVDGWLFEDVFATWAAQPGKVLNLWYGYTARLHPPQNVTQILGAVDVSQTTFASPKNSDQDTYNSKAWGCGIQAASGAGQSCQAGIANLAASGKDVWIDQIIAASSVLGQWVLQEATDVTLTTVVANVTNLRADNTTLATQIRADVGKAGTQTLDQIFLTANGPSIVMPLARPIFVPPGRSVFLSSVNAGVQTLFASFKGREY